MTTPPITPQQNPLLAEIKSHVASMSPGAQAAIHQALPMQGVSTPPDGGNVRSISPPIQDPQAHPAVPPIGGLETQHPQVASTLLPPRTPMSAPPGSMQAPPPIAPPARGTIPGEENETARLISSGSGASQIKNPVGRGLAEFGGALEHIVAPGLEAVTPGTEGHNQRLIQQSAAKTGLLQGQRAADTTNAENEARTGLATAQAGAVPSETALREAQTGAIPSETALREAQTGAIPSEIALRTAETQKDLNPALQKPERPDTPEQQYIDEYQRLHPGSTVGEAERKYALDTQRPPQATIVQVPMIDPNTGRLDVLHKGDVAPQGGMSPTQYGSTSTPTALQKNAGGRADIVLQAIPDVLNDLKQNAGQLGPGMGRFNDIYSGKIGAPNPEFSGLMADLHLLGTAVALAHAQGRMSNELLNEFNSMIAAPQQSSQNIEAVLGKVQNFMQRASEQGKPSIQRGGGGGTQTFHVGNDTYNIPADKVAAFKKEFPNAR